MIVFVLLFMKGISIGETLYYYMLGDIIEIEHGVCTQAMSNYFYKINISI